MEVAFKCATDDVGIEIEGPEEFVRAQIAFLLPWVRRATGAPAPSPVAAAAGPVPPGMEGVGAWWANHVPGGATSSLQDTILLFAYFMRSYRKTVFVSEDIRRCFALMGMEEPKSLLQILGTLRRDAGLLLAAGKRGEYMMSMPGINRVRGILGTGGAGGGGSGGSDGPRPVDANNLFRD